MRIMPHDLAILAGPRLGLVGVHHEVMRAPIRLLRHERPFQPGRKAGAAAPAQPGRLDLFDDRVAALFKKSFGSAPGAARTRTLYAPVVLAVQVSEDTVLVREHDSRLLLGRGCAADGRRQLAVDLRTRLYLLTRCEIVQDLAYAVTRQLLVIVVIDLCHRRIHAGTKAFNLHPGEFAVLSDLTLIADPLAADLLEIVGAAQPAWRRAAKLPVEFADRPQIEHRVESRDLERANVRHSKKFSDMPDRSFRQPAARLLLRAPEHRNNRRLLTALGIFRDLFLRPGKVVLAEGKILRLHFGRCEAADAQRSTSPNTNSIEPRMAETSASIWPRVRKSIACRCAKPGARILHLYGLLVPSETK